MLVPKETSWFGYYPDGAWDPVLPAQETKLYTEDWIGLKTLDEAGKVKFISVPGGHMDVSKREMKQYIVPYLEDGASSSSKQPNIMESSSRTRNANDFSRISSRKEDPGTRPLSVWSSIKQLVGHSNENESLQLNIRD